MPLATTAERRSQYTRRLLARHRARRAAWREAGGDPTRFRHIMRGHVETGYLFYYEEDQVPVRTPGIGQQLLRDVIGLTAWFAVFVVAVVLSDLL